MWVTGGVYSATNAVTRGSWWREYCTRPPPCAAAYYYSDGFGDTSFTISIIPKKNINLEEIEIHLDEYINKIKKKSFNKEELQKVKKRLVYDAIFAQDSLYMGMRIFGSSLTTGYSLKEITNWPKDISLISIDDLQSFIPNIFDKKNSVTGYLLPIIE